MVDCQKYLLHIVWHDIISSRQISSRLDHPRQSDRSSWAYTKLQHRMLSGLCDQLCNIIVDHIMDKDFVDFFLHCQQIVHLDHR